MENKKIVVLGAGGHAKVILDILTINNWNIVGIVDRTVTSMLQFEGYPILGDDDALYDIFNSGIYNAAIGIGYIGNNNVRNNIYHRLKAIGYHLPNIVHPTAVIASNVSMGEGNAVFPGSVINSGAMLGNIGIINTNAIVEHEVLLGNNVHIAPGSVILGAVTIMDNSFIGANSTVIQGKRIGQNVIVGAGSTVIHDIEGSVTVAGSPARVIREG